MRNIMEYKGYHTKVSFDAESLTLHGKIEGIRDFVNFEADSLEAVEAEFHSAVDEYLEFCAEVGKTPDKEYRGTFNVRISPALHRELSLEADKKDVSMNQLVENAIEAYLHKENMPTKTIIYVKENETKSTFKTPPVAFNFPMDSFYNQNHVVTNNG
ncbi:MAG: type II toxin-antitoxin system HicB family antitoxin [Oscillospiraceae bacterium]|nr:type II toxin-antitoxin system HicB family antitoxin [Oscillospiraceae bacterium]